MVSGKKKIKIFAIFRVGDLTVLAKFLFWRKYKDWTEPLYQGNRFGWISEVIDPEKICVSIFGGIGIGM